MDFFDVLFPLNVGVLTYRCPDTFSGKVKPGMIVSAPLKNKIVRGIVTGRAAQAPPGGAKELKDVHGDAPVLNDKIIELIKWMADYYIAEQGLVLKNVLPREAFTKVRRRNKDSKRTKKFSLSLVDTDESSVSRLINAINSAAYKTFLLYAPTSAYECSFLIKILPKIRNGIILVPEVSTAKNLYPTLQELLGERITLFCGDLSGGKKTEAIERVISGQSDIVIGTRSAVFAPLPKVSFIAVVDEQSKSYKQEKIPCYNARDVAVMRGYFEKATVLLSSICPSIESLFNCRTAKYTLLRPVAVRRPRIKLVDMRREKLMGPYLSKAVTDAAIGRVNNDQKVMLVMNRRGHSTFLQCADCGRIEECTLCKIPLVFHKQDMSMKCHYCGYTLSDVPDRCSRCKGYNLKLSGAGTQKIQEDIEKLAAVETIRIDSDRSRRKADLEALISSAVARDRGIIVGTKLMTGRMGVTDRFSMAAVLNADLLLNIPDFRSAEKAYQEILAVIDKVAPGGDVFIQTRMPQNYLFRNLKKYDYDSFCNEELNRRRVLAYPPYSRLLLIRFESKKDLSGKLSEISDRAEKEVEILGPFISKTGKGNTEFKLLLKSEVRGKLHEAAKGFLQIVRYSRDIKVKVDVDPLII